MRLITEKTRGKNSKIVFSSKWQYSMCFVKIDLDMLEDRHEAFVFVGYTGVAQMWVTQSLSF
jgi:hypothetical protein